MIYASLTLFLFLLLLCSRVSVSILARTAFAPYLTVRLSWLGMQYTLHGPMLFQDTSKSVRAFLRLTQAKRDALLSLGSIFGSFLRRWRLTSLRVQIESDCASTVALSQGTLYALAGWLRAATPNAHCELAAVWGSGFSAWSQCIIDVRVGDIILAATRGAWQYTSRRLKTWTSIPSKTS